MFLDDLYLGKEEVIRYGGSRIAARPFRGADGAYKGSWKREEGIFLRRWKNEGPVGATPLQRARKKWRSDEMQFSFFRSGLISAMRGRHFAVAEGKIALLRFKTAERFIAKDVRRIIIEKKFFCWDALSIGFKKRILETGYFFKKARSPEMQENCHQLYCLIAGSKKHPINVGMFLVRTVAITDRLRERLNKKYAWISKYKAQEQVFAAIYREFLEAIDSLRDDLKFWFKHPFVKGRKRVAETQMRLLADRVDRSSLQLQPFEAIGRPFEDWVLLTIGDLENAAKAAKLGDAVETAALLRRVELSLEIKKRQRELERLIWKIREDLLLGGYRSKKYFYLEEFSRLKKMFNDYSVREVGANFRQPVCQEVMKKLELAEERIGRFSLFGRKPLEEARERLKEASALL